MYLLNEFKSGTERLKEINDNNKRQITGSVIGAGLLSTTAKLTEKAYKKNKKSKYDKLVGNDSLNKSFLKSSAENTKQAQQKLKDSFRNQLNSRKIPDTLIDTKISRRQFGKTIKEEFNKIRNTQAKTRLLHAVAAGALVGGGAGLVYNKLRKSRADKGRIRGKYSK